MKYIFFVLVFINSLLSYSQNCEGVECLANPKITQITNIIECFVTDPLVEDSLFDNFQTDTVGECANDCIDVCENSTVSFSTPYSIGSQYTWNVIGGDIIEYFSFNSGVVIKWDNSTNGALLVEEIDSNGCSKSDFICIDIKPTPVPQIQTFSGDSVFCVETEIQFFGNNQNANELIEQGCYPNWIYDEFYWLFDSLQTQYSYSTHYFWDFGDGNTSTQANPIHTYSSSGPKTVTLVMYNNCQCSDTISIDLFINSDTGPKIESCIGAICQGDTALYCTDAEIPGWSINGGSILNNTINQECIKVVWDNNDNSLTDGEGTLIVTDGSTSCGSGQTYFSVPILPSNPVVVGSELVCENTYEVYSYECIPGVEYNWSVVGGTIVGGFNTSEIKVSWGSQGNGQVTLNLFSSTIECGIAQTVINVEILPPININGVNLACEDQSYTFFEDQFSNTIQWSVDNGNILNLLNPIDNISNQIEVIFNQDSGPASINATATQEGVFCQEMSTFNLNIVERPQSILTISGDSVICAGETYIYTLLDPNTNDQNTTYNWLIIGGTANSNTGETVTIEWDPIGPYEVNVYTQFNNNPYCYSDTTSLSLNEGLTTLPVISGSTTSCTNSISTYQLETNYPTGSVISWNLSNSNFGSIVAGQGSNIVEVEWGNTPGFVDLNIEVDVCGQSTTSSLTIELINEQISFSFGDTLLCSEEAITFVPSSITGEYFWQFGDGTSSTAQSPLKTYDEPGVYNVNLTFFNSINQCQSTYNSTVSIAGINGQLFPKGTSLFCASTEINLPLNIVSNSTYTPSIEWFSNGVSLGNFSEYAILSSPPNHSGLGNYSAVIYDENGCQNTLNEIVIDTVNCSGGGSWFGNDPNLVCPSLSNLPYTSSCNSDLGTNTFIFNSPDGNVVQWRLDNGPVSSSATSTFTFDEAGIHNVRARSASCLIGVEQITIPLVVDFTYSVVCNPLENNEITYHFNDISSYLNGYGMATYSWDFGDGNGSMVQNPTHNYSSNGPFIVRLTVDYGGYSCDKITVINHNDFLIDYSSVGPQCESTPTLTFSSFNNITPISSWLWDFGDGSSSARPSPQRTFSNPSNYSTTLQVTDIFGCIANNSQLVTIESTPTINSISNIPPICSNDSPIDLTLLIDYDVTNGETAQWSGQGVEYELITQTYLFNPLLAGGGQHQLCAVVTDNNDCFVEECINVDVICPEKPNVFGKSDFCLTTDFEIYTYTTQNGMSNYQWYVNGAPQLGNTQNISFNTFFIETVDNLMVEFTDDNGCSSISEPFTISAKPLPSAFTAFTTTNNCPEQSLTLSHNGNENNVAYQWNTPEKHIQTTIDIISQSNFDYYVLATNQFGCKRKSNSISTHQAPNMCSVLSGCYCDSSIVNNNNTILISGVSPYGFYDVEWLKNGASLPNPLFSNNLSLDLSDPNYSNFVPGTFNLQVTDNYGCVYTSEDLHIETNCSPCDEELFSIIKDTICEGDIYSINGTNFNTSGDYTTSFMTLDGCDTTVLLELTVLPTDTLYLFHEDCDSFIWNDETYTESGSYIYAETNSFGCSQTHILELMIQSSDSSQSSVSSCDSYTWDNVTYNETGVYTNLYTNSDGCDSIHTLDLTILPSSASLDQQIHCDEFTWIDGITYTQSNNTATYVLTNSYGCDSLVSLSLTINEADSLFESVIVCDEYTWIDGQTYFDSELLTHTLTNSNGCDSVIILDLNVSYSSTVSDTATACWSYNWNENIYTISGIYTYETMNDAGCSETNVLNLTINDTLIFETSAFVCGPFEWNGVTYYESGLYSFQTVDSNNCVNVEYLNFNLSVFDSLVISGDTLIFIDDLSASYSILNAKETSTYSWNIENGSGSIDATSLNSSEVDIDWVFNDDIAKLCITELDQYGCFSQETCLDIVFKEGNSSVLKLPIVNLEIFPNPSEGILNVIFESSQAQNISIRVLDKLGKSVQSFTLNDYEGKYSEVIDLSDQSAGVYFLEIKTKNEQIYNKVVVH